VTGFRYALMLAARVLGASRGAQGLRGSHGARIPLNGAGLWPGRRSSLERLACRGSDRAEEGRAVRDARRVQLDAARGGRRCGRSGPPVSARARLHPCGRSLLEPRGSRRGHSYPMVRASAWSKPTQRAGPHPLGRSATPPPIDRTQAPGAAACPPARGGPQRRAVPRLGGDRTLRR
jgi:hypothetical protein